MKVTLTNIKAIRSLEFELPAPGVWLITGLNGSGKSSLFAALLRIRVPTAFQKYFRTGSLESVVDRYADAAIKYEIGAESVTYHYGGSRWRASPRKNVELLQTAPYGNVDFVEANADRIEPFANEVSTRRLRDCSADLRAFLSHVLADHKWDQLSYVNTTRGRWSRPAYLIPYTANGRRAYYSERSFSLGELCVLKLAARLLDVDPGSLVLVDEVEMALHPQAQARLFQKLGDVAAAKNLTVLFSTHSATLIKTAPRKQLIYLQGDGAGAIRTVYKPFPAQVLGEMAFDDEFQCDFIFYVEDDQARIYLSALIGLYLKHVHPDPSNRPLFRLMPIGGWAQVVGMLASAAQVVPAYVRRFAVLDADARATLQDAVRNDRQPIKGQYELVENNVHYLPCAPEQGLIDFIERDLVGNVERTRALDAAFPGHALNIAALIGSRDYQQLNAVNLRKRAKDRLSLLVERLALSTGADETHILRLLYARFCDFSQPAPYGPLRALLGPIFNAH